MHMLKHCSIAADMVTPEFFTDACRACEGGVRLYVDTRGIKEAPVNTCIK